MKIAFFTDTFYPNVDGVVTTLVNYRNEMQRKGEKVFVFTSGDRKTREENKDNRVFVFHSVRFPPYPQYKIALYPFNSSEIAREKKIEIVHCHALASMGLAAIKTSRDLQVPLLGTFHTMVPLAAKKMVGKTAEKILWKAVKVFYDRFDLVTCPTETIRGILREKGVESVVVPNGVDTEKYNPRVKANVVRNLIAADKIVLVAGRISQEKNVDVIVRAASEVLKQTNGLNVKFVITGDGPDRKRIEEMAKSEGLWKNFVFTGFVKQEHLPSYYAASDCFATASTFETQGLALLEAMACGKPVVGAKAMAIPEAVRNGKNGFLFPPGDEGACAEKILKILGMNKAGYARMSKNARATAEKFSVPKSTSKMLDIYAELLHR
ncbi:MAG: glycosyltransferase [Candidatus Norongarragalinales archaeon]